MNNSKIKNRLQQLPQKPGVYIFLNKKGIILYVGKAKNLKKRVSSYFIKNKELAPNKELMLPKISKIDYIVADSELEALLLESNLIKKEKPKYNVVLKDDKQYQYIKIDYSDDFPKIYTTREIKKNKASYYGPFTNGCAVKNTLNLLNKLFPYRECDLEIYENSKKRRVCLKYHIKRCLGPCAHYISKDNYNKLIKQSELFLQGKQDKILSEIKKEMKTVANNKNFEKAAILRDQIFNLEKVIEKQKVISLKKIDQDIISFFQKHNSTIINLFIIREGKLLGKENFYLKTINKNIKEILSSFIKLHYLNKNIAPQEIIIQKDIEDKYLIASTLSKKTNKKINITVPQKGKNLKLIKLGEKNAKLFYQNLSIKEKPSRNRKDQIKVLKNIKKLFSLNNLPHRIECYDISNIQGTSATGAMIVFQNGMPKKSEYRRFRIKFNSISDTDMMEEMLTRRFKHQDTSKIRWPLPNLVIIDGSLGQLNVAVQIIKEQKLDIPIVSIAKRLEELYSPDSDRPIRLSKNSKELQLIQNIRDEAHRFAITYHKKIREKKLSASELDSIRGIGDKKHKDLLKRFKTVSNIKMAGIDDLEKILDKKLAIKLVKKFSKYKS